MARFESLKHAPGETRKVLRERFARNLPVYRHAHVPTQAEHVFDDELVLELFQHLEVVSNDKPERARELYDEARKIDQGAPTLDELIADGWAASGWQCLSVPRDVARAAVKEGSGKFAPFFAWRDTLYDSDYRVRMLSEAQPELVELAESVVSKSRLPAHIACLTPAWVAARAWDRDERHHSGAPDVLFDWLQVWEMLNQPELIPSEVWREDARKHFEIAALAVLENDAKPLSWNEYRQRGALQFARARGAETEQFASYLPPIPTTLVSRATWLVDNRMEFLRYENRAWRHAAGLMTLLLAEVEHAELAPTPHPVASRVLDLALKHPEVLSSVLFCVNQRPTLLADFTLKPETSALGCLLISKWQVAFGAWDRQLTVRDNEAARNEAFIDALSVMCHHAKSSRLAPAEVAALLHELHASVAHDDGASTGNVMLAALRSELVGFSRSILVAMYDALVSVDYETNVGLPAFSAALDLVDIGQLVPDIDCARLVGAYIESIRKQEYRLSAARITPDGAAALFEMSERVGGETQQGFLVPLDVKARLAGLAASDENPYTVKQELAHALRVHMRVLARAVIGQRDNIPPRLVAALAEAIYSGAHANTDKGRIAAFSARFEVSPTGPVREAGLARDFARALGCVSDADGQRLLKEILEVDEPAFPLAQLCKSTPAAMQPAIRERIRQLVPSKADDAWYFTDLHLRIDELIAIGEYSTAEAYIASEPEPPKPLAGQFAVGQLRHRLQLALATKDWDSLENATVPSDIPQVNVNEARDAILFYGAVAQFTKEGGDIEIAERAFAALHERHLGVPEYGFNLFAARLGRLVGSQPFTPLRGGDLARARELLLDAEQLEAAYDVTTPRADSYLGNKAILLFVLGRTHEAAEVLRGIFLTRMTDRVGAYLSVALARLGRKRDALATLDVAEQSLGASDILQMARAHVTEGRPVSGMSLQLVEPDSSLAQAKEALLRMHQMDPMQQAELWSIPPDAFLTFVTEQVRHAAASIVALVPMMKGVTLDSCEDDVNTVVRELLASRLSFLNWAVHDQSRRGYSGNANFGALDLLIQKGTSDLAAIEAVVCKYSARAQTTKKELISHFQKLLGYSTCKLFFHLTYSRVSDIASIVALLKNIARGSAPPSFEYEEMSDFPPTDSRPTGFRARYRTPDGDADVVFLVLNLAQDGQRDAAKLAATNSPRAPRKGGAGAASAQQAPKRTRVSK